MTKPFGLGAVYTYSGREWRIAGVLLVSSAAVSVIAAHYLPAAVALYPAVALALGALFFGGMRIFPAAYGAMLAACALTGVAAPFIVILPVAATAQAVAGAYLLRALRVDPLFRRYRDTFYFTVTVFAASFIGPTLGIFAGADWGQAYAASLFCFFVITPFILRWFTKPRFSRTLREAVEIGAVFAVLLGINVLFFVGGVQTVSGVSVAYILLVPLLFIALRLRPRFVTLALLITALFAIAAPAGNLFEVELFLIALSIISLTVASLEEELRVNANLMHSQFATLENAVSRVSSESKAKNDFIAVLAHELRNPLAPIVSALELLKLKGTHDEDDVRAFDMMTERMGVVRHLLDDLLDISRISEHKVVLKQETVNLEVVLEHAVLSTNHHRKQRHQQLVFRAPKTPLLVRGDPVRLEQIFSNLLTNASKYSDSGDTITLSAQQKDSTAEIEVSDEGLGLSPGALETIFIPFHQLEQSERSMKGLGIGLALVRSFVEMHGGTVAAASDGPGLGSRFTVSLPLFHSGIPSIKRRGAAALVVDDNDAASGSLGRLLELEGCSVMYAYDTAQAVEQGMRLSPDIIFINTGMPHQDGYAVANTLRGRGFKGHLVALAGSLDKGAGEPGAEGVFGHFLLKPPGLSEVKRVLNQLTPLAK
ncbi:MAG: ATP-binding protein [Patescibacteria group bacterium]